MAANNFNGEETNDKENELFWLGWTFLKVLKSGMNPNVASFEGAAPFTRKPFYLHPQSTTTNIVAIEANFWVKSLTSMSGRSADISVI